jgi:hypothetical protein
MRLYFCKRVALGPNNPLSIKGCNPMTLVLPKEAIRCCAELKFRAIHLWMSGPAAAAALPPNHYLACGPLDSRAEDAIAASSGFW